MHIYVHFSVPGPEETPTVEYKKAVHLVHVVMSYGNFDDRNIHYF